MTELERLSEWMEFNSKDSFNVDMTTLIIDNIKAADIRHIIERDFEDKNLALGYEESYFILHEDYTEEEFKSFKEFMGSLEHNELSELYGTIWLKDDDRYWLETEYDSDGYGGYWRVLGMPDIPKRTVEEVI